jgi:hypothetical protein
MAGAGFQLSERVILDPGYRFIDRARPVRDIRQLRFHE